MCIRDRIKGAQAIVIGPAGEQQIRFACIKNNRWRSAGPVSYTHLDVYKRQEALCINAPLHYFVYSSPGNSLPHFKLFLLSPGQGTTIPVI